MTLYPRFVSGSLSHPAFWKGSFGSERSQLDTLISGALLPALVSLVEGFFTVPTPALANVVLCCLNATILMHLLSRMV